MPEVPQTAMSSTEMMPIIMGGWVFSLISLVATIIFVAWLARRHNRTDSPVSSWVAYTAGIYVTVFWIVLSQELVRLVGTDVLFVFLDSLFNSLQIFVMNRDLDVDIEALEWMGGMLSPYLFYNALLFLAAPVGTLGVIFSLIGKLFVVARIKLLASSRPVYVFSTITDRSLALAKSIAKEHTGKKKCLVIFAGMKNEESPLVFDAKGAGIVCAEQSIEYIARKIGGGGQERTYLLSSDDENENISAAAKLARTVAESRTATSAVPRVLLFSSSEVGGPVVDALAGELNGGEGGMRVRIRRIDWIRDTVDMLLDSFPLFTVGLDETCLIYPGEGEGRGENEFKPKLAFDFNVKRRRIVVVGNGSFATEFVKGALWATQLGSDITTQIDVVTCDDGQFRERLALECPELFADDGRPYQGFFRLSFIEINAESGAYQNYLLDRDVDEPREEVTYVVVALDDDLACAKVARRTREILEQRRFRKQDPHHPAFISAVINDSELSKAILLMEKRSRYYGILPIGDAESVFDYESVFNQRLSSYVKNINRVYCHRDIKGEGEAFSACLDKADISLANSEYNQRSSLAAALHRKYSLYLFCKKTGFSDEGIDWTASLSDIALVKNTAKRAGKDADDYVKAPVLEAYERYLATEDFAWLAKIEHDRWSAYVATEGNEFAAPSEIDKMYRMVGRHEYSLAHLHGCLVQFDDLPKLDDALLSATGKKREPFQDLDNVMLKSVGVIAAGHRGTKEFSEIWHEYFPDEKE